MDKTKFTLQAYLGIAYKDFSHQCLCGASLSKDSRVGEGINMDKIVVFTVYLCPDCELQIHVV